MKSQKDDIIQVFTESPLRNFNYLIHCENDEWVCIDPFDGEQIESILNDLGGRLRAIFNTHEHWDHTAGNDYLLKRYDCIVLAHKNIGRVSNPGSTYFKGEGIFQLSEGRYIRSIDTPGHTFSSLTFILECQTKENGSEKIKIKAAFTGDTLFNAGVGHCRDGSAEELFLTISEIYSQFPDDMLIYPGHEYLGNNLRFTLAREPNNPKAKELLALWEKLDWKTKNYVTTMKEEKEISTFFRLDNSEVISLLEGDKSDEKQVFLRLRELRNKW